MDAQSATMIAIFVINAIVSAGVALVVAGWRIGTYQNKVDNLETTIGKDEHSGLRRTVADVRDKVVACETSLKERGPLTKRRSPEALTERGEKFLIDSGGKNLVDENFDELLKKIDEVNSGLSSVTAYDIQEAAKQAIKSIDESKLTKIKDFLFKDGSTLDDFQAVTALYLRDKALEYKKMNVADIDEHGKLK